jgi:hypothetical protein
MANGVSGLGLGSRASSPGYLRSRAEGTGKSEEEQGTGSRALCGISKKLGRTIEGKLVPARTGRLSAPETTDEDLTFRTLERKTTHCRVTFAKTWIEDAVEPRVWSS